MRNREEEGTSPQLRNGVTILGSYITHNAANAVQRRQRKVLAGTYGLLFRQLGLLDVDRDGGLVPVSEKASLFLQTLSCRAKDNLPLVGSWRAEGTRNPEAMHLGEILTEMEEFRIDASGGGEGAPPARRVSGPLVIIKAMKGSMPVLLMWWSDAWGGYD